MCNLILCRNQLSIGKGWLQFVLQLILGIVFYNASAQCMDCNQLLDQEPYFVRHQALPSDPLFKKDIRILRHCGNFNGLDSELLRAPILGTLMLEQLKSGNPATYRTVIGYLRDFEKTDSYHEFITGLLLYKKLEYRKVDPEHWAEDKMLFVRMGFTESDLEDFEQYILAPAHQHMTYKEAYVSYMNDLEALK